MTFHLPSTSLLTGASLVLAMGAVFAAPAASDEGPYPKRQPGSWSSTIEITSVSGKGADDAKKQMNDEFAKIAGTSICLTPKDAAKEDMADNAAKAFGGKCVYTEKDLAGTSISLRGSCGEGVQRVQIAIAGTVSPTAQDFDISVSGDSGEGEQSIEMLVHSRRNGECTAKDMRPDAPAGQ